MTALRYEAHFVRRQLDGEWYLEVTDQITGGLPLFRRYGPIPEDALDIAEAEIRTVYAKTFQSAAAWIKSSLKDNDHGLATQDDSHPTTVDAQPGTTLE